MSDNKRPRKKKEQVGERQQYRDRAAIRAEV